MYEHRNYYILHIFINLSTILFQIFNIFATTYSRRKSSISVILYGISKNQLKIGGGSSDVKIDNLKSGILSANFYEPVYQELYKSFAQHYGFEPIPCRISSPNDKGKVECGIKYVKNNFFAGRRFENGNDLDSQLRNWLDNTCNQRIHGTTRKVRQIVFELEKKNKLKPLPIEEFKMPQVGIRKVYHDCHIYVDYSYYSVPFEYVGKEVNIEVSATLVKVFYQNKQIACHIRSQGRGNFCTNPNHYPKYKRMSETEYQEKYQVKMAELGPYAQQLFFLVVNEHPWDWSRTIQGILTFTKAYPSHIIDLACKRAIAFRAIGYQIIKNILKSGSYNLPIEFNCLDKLENDNTDIGKVSNHYTSEKNSNNGQPEAKFKIDFGVNSKNHQNLPKNITHENDKGETYEYTKN